MISIRLPILVMFLTGIFVQVALAQSEESFETVRKQFPFAVLESDTIDLGKLGYGQQIRPSIRIRNEGEHDMLIAKVRSSCGLMIPTWPVEPVAHGDEAVIQLRYDTSRLGPFVRYVVIHTNAWQKTLTVTVMGEITP